VASAAVQEMKRHQCQLPTLWPSPVSCGGHGTAHQLQLLSARSCLQQVLHCLEIFAAFLPASWHVAGRNNRQCHQWHYCGLQQQGHFWILGCNLGSNLHSGLQCCTGRWCLEAPNLHHCRQCGRLWSMGCSLGPNRRSGFQCRTWSLFLKEPNLHLPGEHCCFWIWGCSSGQAADLRCAIHNSGWEEGLKGLCSRLGVVP